MALDQQTIVRVYRRRAARYDFTATRKPEGIVLLARPKAEDVKKYVTSLELATGPEPWTVSRVVIEEKNGDRSVIRFSTFARDVPVDPERMRPPKK